jgi:hypothetical protein
LVAIGQGRSEVAPVKGDKRFTDPAWQGNPLLKRTVQAYLATSFDYRWLREQGDVLQHADINAFKYNLTARLHGEPAVIIDVDRECLLEFTKRSWKRPWLKRSELQAMDSDPSVLTMIQNIQPLMRELEPNVNKILYPNVAQDVAIVKQLIGRFNGRQGLYALQTGPGFTQRLRLPPFRPLARRVLAFAENYEPN